MEIGDYLQMNSRLIFLLLGVVAAWIIALNTGRELAFSLA